LLRELGRGWKDALLFEKGFNIGLGHCDTSTNEKTR
jgi:hypothetical protein